MATVITGARALIKLSGDVVAFAAGVSVTHENRLDEIAQLDDIIVGEYAENGHRCSVSIDMFKLTSDAQIGGQSIANSANFYGLNPEDDIKKLLLQPEIIIEIVDEVPVRDANNNIIDYNQAAIYTAYGAKFEGGDGAMDARGVWRGRWNFKARYGVGF